MQNETLKMVAELLNSFNKTFDLEAKAINGEEESAEITIKNMKNDGSELVKTLYDTFNAIVEVTSEEHEVMYIEGKGLVVAKKVVKYVVEEFN